MGKTFYITTAIDYTNSAPHIGHAYEKVLADVIARYHRLKGDKIFFLTGVDQHGQKVQQSAAKAGVPPAEFVKGVTQKFVDLWEKLDVKYDAWAETIDPRHKKIVQGMLQRLYDEKQIYEDKQAGHYSIRQEQFLTDKERGPDGEFGPEWGQVEFREEENYYFRLEQHKQWLLDLIDKRAKEGRSLVDPDFREVELRNAVEKIGGDLCISRPKSRLDWGIELPFDKNFVTYVWFDALSNYISFAGYDPNAITFADQPDKFRDLWSSQTLQVIGKDILIPAHGIYWLIMLHALGFPDNQMPQLLVHGWWNLGGAKMSKTAGNVVDPFVLLEKYGLEALRYYLMSGIATGLDADFSEERLVEQYNTRLANNIGNLLNRALNMAARYCAGEAKCGAESTINLKLGPLKFLSTGSFDRGSLDNYRRWMAGFDPDCALEEINYLASSCNGFIEEQAPWKLARDPGNAAAVNVVIYTVLEALRIIAIRLFPILPRAAHGIFDQLNWKMELSGKEERFSLKDALWGQLPDGHVVGKPVPLFPRIET